MSASSFREDFQIDQWSDNWIKLSIDPNLKGIDDQDNVTLVIQRQDGKQAGKGGKSTRHGVVLEGGNPTSGAG